ncbi:hypothetical protein ACF0H5_017929 [Mactra antiquata]
MFNGIYTGLQTRQVLSVDVFLIGLIEKASRNCDAVFDIFILFAALGFYTSPPSLKELKNFNYELKEQNSTVVLYKTRGSMSTPPRYVNRMYT